MNKDGLNFKQKITVLAFFIFLGIVVIAQTEYAYKTDISQQKERARLNAKVYADELCIDFEGGKNITDALDDTVVASNGQVNNFARIAEHEMEDYISSIQLAPDSKVQYIYPLEGNEAGLIDLLADKKRGEIVKYSIENKVTSMQGPFKLKQGGYGIAIRNPIFMPSQDGKDSFWGFSIAIIKVPDIFKDTLDALGSFGYDYCLYATESPLSSKKVRAISSFSSKDQKLGDPVTESFQAGGCVWTLNVERQGGWKSERLPIVLLTGIIYQLFATAVVYLLLRTRQQHKELLKKSITDELTGLLSRRGLVEALEKYKKNNNKDRMTAAMIDLDDFKQINDLYGHDVGDEALKNLAANLRESFPDSSVISRSGGDEFCVILFGKSPEECEEIIREASKKEQFFEYENNRYKYTISIGYADYPEQADGIKAVVNHADEALYSAKLAGKHRCFHFEPAMANAKRTQLGFSFKDVVNGIPGALLIYSAAGDEEILYANNELIKLMGCSDFEDFMAWSKGSFRGFVHPDDLDEVEKSIHRQIDGSLSEKNHQEDYVEYRIIRNDGSILPVVDIGRLISTENHGDVFFVFIRPRDEFKKNF